MNFSPPTLIPFDAKESTLPIWERKVWSSGWVI